MFNKLDMLRYSKLDFGMDIEKVIEFFGKTDLECAEKLGVTKGAISQWRQDGIPELRQYQIETLTGGRFKADRSKKERVA